MSDEDQLKARAEELARDIDSFIERVDELLYDALRAQLQDASLKDFEKQVTKARRALEKSRHDLTS